MVTQKATVFWCGDAVHITTDKHDAWTGGHQPKAPDADEVFHDRRGFRSIRHHVVVKQYPQTVPMCDGGEAGEEIKDRFNNPASTKTGVGGNAVARFNVPYVEKRLREAQKQLENVAGRETDESRKKLVIRKQVEFDYIYNTAIVNSDKLVNDEDS